ncbi:MAG: ATP-dependent helicase HrpB [Wenzhouxiangellaceae bacterium]
MAKLPQLPVLPIDAVIAELQQCLESHSRVILQAPPGAGKSTRVPLALLNAPWLDQRRIVMLEPRRLAARSVATHMARLLGEPVGRRVGYRMRQESRISDHTCIEVVTEGILTRMLQDDPALESVAIVIFDEFHERSLHADLGLSLCLDSQAALREDLRLLLMSATLDDQALSRTLDDAPVVISSGRSYPVSHHYRPVGANWDTEWNAFYGQVAREVADITAQTSGSLLVFLPGMAEIRRVEQLLQTALSHTGVAILPLHGQLSTAEQDRAIAPCAPEQRKIVLASAIAETSLTIEGVRVVVDTGLERRPQFDPNSGLSRLRTQRVSAAAAAQRSGRAGRLEAGECFRLWPESLRLQPYREAEILHSDLTGLVLELAGWGVHERNQLTWLDQPPAGPWSQARELLQRLGAVDDAGLINNHGRQLLKLGTHPRLGHMLLHGRQLGRGQLACYLAALLEERDPLKSGQDCDIRSRLEWLLDQRNRQPLAARIRQQAGRWLQQLAGDTAAGQIQLEDCGLLLAYAYPDRIAQQRNGQRQRYQLSNGRGAHLPAGDPLTRDQYLVAAWLEGGSEARIRLAAALSLEQLMTHHHDLIELRHEVFWDDSEGATKALSRECLDALVISQKPWRQAPPEQLTRCLLEGIRQHGLGVLPWTDAAQSWRQRLEFLRQVDPQDWPDCSDAGLSLRLEDWLEPFLAGASRLDHLQRIDLLQALRSQLDWQQQQRLEQQAPTHLTVPSGSRIRLDYSQSPPILAVKLQEMFGQQETPRVAGGRVAVVLHLLSPARRPVQVTQDLTTFWASGYAEVKKELKGRYPKHYWPDDPYQAVATARVRPQ